MSKDGFDICWYLNENSSKQYGYFRFKRHAHTDESKSRNYDTVSKEKGNCCNFFVYYVLSVILQWFFVVSGAITLFMQNNRKVVEEGSWQPVNSGKHSSIFFTFYLRSHESVGFEFWFFVIDLLDDLVVMFQVPRINDFFFGILDFTNLSIYQNFCSGFFQDFFKDNLNFLKKS
jgi:hypothetical protein